MEALLSWIGMGTVTVTVNALTGLLDAGLHPLLNPLREPRA